MFSLKRFSVAASYLTSIPGFKKAEVPEDLEGLTPYLPSVGLVIGLLLLCLALALEVLDANELISAFILAFAWLLLTGGIHLDGLMDTADGIFCHQNKERMLEVMRDSRVGNFGAVSGLAIILAKLIALASMPQSLVLLSLFLVPGWSRYAELCCIVEYPYARPEGMGKAFKDSSSKKDLWTGSIAPLAATIAAAFFCNPGILVLIPLAVLSSGFIISRQLNKKLGGQTGDTYGACVEFSEAAALIFLALACKPLLLDYLPV